MAVTMSHTSPFGNVARSQYSSTLVLSLYVTPFFRSHPSARFVVTTFKVPPGGLVTFTPRPARTTGGGEGPPIGSQSAIECPCSERAPDGCDRSNRKRRVCIPASLSTFSAVSPSHVM